MERSWVQGVYTGGFSERLLEASSISNKATTSQLQEDLLLTKAKTISDGGDNTSVIT